MTGETKHSPEPWALGLIRGSCKRPDHAPGHHPGSAGFAPCTYTYELDQSPWNLDGIVSVPENTQVFAPTMEDGERPFEDAHRAVVCVNALAGVPTSALESGALAKALDLLIEALVDEEHAASVAEHGDRSDLCLACRANEIARALGRLPSPSPEAPRGERCICGAVGPPFAHAPNCTDLWRAPSPDSDTRARALGKGGRP
jgi:hypothetical protein